MHKNIVVLWIILALTSITLIWSCKNKYPTTWLGRQSLALTKEITDFGPRAPGSEGIEKVRTWLKTRITSMGFETFFDRFVAKTPLGPIEMVNVSYVIPGVGAKKEILLCAHYDSKTFPNFNFVGANDSASAVALLLVLSPEIQKRKFPFDVRIVFFDGEEALVEWTEEDSLYGSRHFANTYSNLESILLAIVIDMISDRDLSLINSVGVDSEFFELFQQVLKKKGWSDLLSKTPIMVQDDHVPLIKKNIRVLHLMDFSYGSKNSPGRYWHTPLDTIEHVSVQSLSVMADILLDFLDKCQAYFKDAVPLNKMPDT